MDEFESIRTYFTSRFANQVQRSPQIAMGIGDDCAIISPPQSQSLVISTDTQVDGRHFPKGCAASIVAYRALGAAVSDLAAMGAEPLGFTLSLAIPALDKAWLEDFSLALAERADELGIPLIGGDTVKGELAVSITVLGAAPVGQALTRAGANPEDDLWVTGTLGDAAAGLSIAISEDSAGFVTETANALLLAAYQKPQPQLAFGQKLRGVATAAIDISDGLVADVGHLCRASQLCAEIWLDMLPMSQAILDFWGLTKARLAACSGGDDYQLCFTAPASCRDFFTGSQFSQPATRIGRLVHGAEKLVRVLDGDNELTVSEQGYNHFSISTSGIN